MTKQHNYGTSGTTSKKHQQRGKNSNNYRPDPPELSIVKVDANTVPYGVDISRNGRACWAAYYRGELIAIGYSADDARRKCQAELCRRLRRRAEGDGQKCCT